MSDTVYSGMRWPDGHVTVRMRRGKIGRPLPVTQGYALSLPSRFDWGDESPRSQHLAHALLSHCLGWKIADRLYLPFCIAVVAKYQRHLFVVSSDQLEQWVTGWIYAARTHGHPEIDEHHRRKARGEEGPNDQ